MKYLNFLIILFSFMQVSNSFAVQSYPLTCKFDGNQHPSLRPWHLDEKKYEVVLSFKPARKAASAGIAPGTCAWDDREFRPGEPTYISHVTSNVLTYNFSSNGVAQLYPGNASWVLKVGTPGETVKFNVYGATDGSPVPYFRVDAD